MTDDDKALVEVTAKDRELGNLLWRLSVTWASRNDMDRAIARFRQAALEAQAAEIERLEREVKKQRSLRDQYRAAWEAEKARAALGETE